MERKERRGHLRLQLSGGSGAMQVFGYVFVGLVVFFESSMVQLSENEKGKSPLL